MDKAMGKDFTATSVHLSEDAIVIEWNDGQSCQYSAMEMRLNCRCAECVEEWSQRRILDPASVPSDIRAEDYILVGNYAIRFSFSDGHTAGIYSWDYLRSLDGDAHE